MKKLQEVYKINGFPEFTFVKPKEYTQLYVALDTPGRSIIIEGPSGIGKTSAIKKAMTESNLHGEIIYSARKKEDIAKIRKLLTDDFSLAIIDDFHRLDQALQKELADMLKSMADDEVIGKKMILIGINDAGKSLIHIASDIVNRVEIITFESNSDSKIEELLFLGEKALNITLNTKDEIIESSKGSFYLAQLLAYHSCIEANLLIEQERKTEIQISFELVKNKVQNQLAKKFKERTVDFAQGSKLRQEGRAPYLNILHRFAKSGQWTLDLKQLAKQNIDLKGSVSQIITKGHLETLYSNLPDIQEVIYYDPTYQKLTIQDPQYLYYLHNLAWHTFAREVGYLMLSFPKEYDFALSFAGADREYAEKLFNTLSDRDVSVFYDKNEQHRIIAEDVEDYLRPIYQSESEFIIVFLGKNYPQKIWTKIESEAYDDRYGKSIIPIIFPDTTINFSDKLYSVGHLSLDPNGNIDQQIILIADTICKKLISYREDIASAINTTETGDLFN